MMKDISQGLYHSKCFFCGYILLVATVNCWIEKGSSELSQKRGRSTLRGMF